MATHTERPINVEQAAEFLNLAKYTIYTNAKKGIIPSYRAAGKVLFFESELLEWVKAGRRTSKFELETIVDNTIASHK